MDDFEGLLGRLEELLFKMEELDEPLRSEVFELLDGIDTLHRAALGRLEPALGAKTLETLRRGDPALAWLLDAYAVGVDQQAAAEAALEPVRPYIHSHGGSVQVLDVRDGVVRLRLAGACSGCTASAITLKEGIEQALAERFAGFRGLDVEEDDAEPHPPPGPTLVQINKLERR
jgi:Fe-S cluster biogenesis protein NfuA